MSKVDDTREVFDIACRGLEDVSKRTVELKRKGGPRPRHDQIPQGA